MPFTNWRVIRKSYTMPDYRESALEVEFFGRKDTPAANGTKLTPFWDGSRSLIFSLRPN
jgi:hypothetical protein